MIKILYKCQCTPEEVSVEVPDRPEGADILAWMEIVQMTLGLDHRSRSPRCQRTALEYAKIPMDENAPGIGMKPKLQS